jgi:streptomycin 6-kinase
VFKVDSPDGPAALKLYKEVGSSGEGVAVHFLRNLAPNVGVKVFRSNTMRTAILMEWLEGPTLEQLVDQGEEARATKLLGEVADAVSQTNFKLSIIYRRVAPGLKRDFAKCFDQSDPVQQPRELQRSITLLDHLMQTTPQEQVIHGDLGFGNVILTDNGPRLFDPKGFRADPAFELAKALVMPYDILPLAEFIKRVESRATVLATAIDTTPLRLIQWAAIIIAHKAIYGARKRPENSRLLPYLTTLLDMTER